MCGLRKGDQSVGSDIGDLGRIPGRALGKVAHPGEADYGCSGEVHTVEAGMGRGCLQENKSYEHEDTPRLIFT